MRRRMRGIIANVAFFWVALFVLIYLNHHQSTNKTFAWTTIRYKTTSATLPEARGICLGLEGSSTPALVVARVAADDSKWLDALADLYHLCVYTADAPTDTTSTHLQVPANRGHEAMAYLTFLIDNYAHIPVAGAVFVHGSRWAWHNDDPDYDNAALLAALNVSAALAPLGYHNLRCDWSASTCSPSEAPPQGSVETLARAMLEPARHLIGRCRALSRPCLAAMRLRWFWTLSPTSMPRPKAAVGDYFWAALMLFVRSVARSLPLRAIVCGSILVTSMLLCDSGCSTGAATAVPTSIRRDTVAMRHRTTITWQAESCRMYGTFCSCGKVNPTPRIRYLVHTAVSTWSGSIHWHVRAPTSVTAACMGVAILKAAQLPVVAVESIACRRTLDYPLTGRPGIRELQREIWYFLIWDIQSVDHTRSLVHRVS
jgi:hypothetical protein